MGLLFSSTIKSFQLLCLQILFFLSSVPTTFLLSFRDPNSMCFQVLKLSSSLGALFIFFQSIFSLYFILESSYYCLQVHSSLLLQCLKSAANSIQCIIYLQRFDLLFKYLPCLFLSSSTFLILWTVFTIAILTTSLSISFIICANSGSSSLY